MAVVKLQSRSLASVDYEAKTKTLRVEFNSGRVYRYFGVPERTYQDLLKAESKGRFFNRWIRECFPYEEEVPKSKQAFS
jgi:hypothetical protein